VSLASGEIGRDELADFAQKDIEHALVLGRAGIEIAEHPLEVTIALFLLVQYLDGHGVASLSALSDDLQRDGEGVEVVASLRSERLLRVIRVPNP
jgi:hypothetical protein